MLEETHELRRGRAWRSEDSRRWIAGKRVLRKPAPRRGEVRRPTGVMLFIWPVA